MKPGYKQSEVGVIPEEWEVKPLAAVVDFLDGRRRPVKDSDRAKMRGDIPYYGASGIVDYVNAHLFDEDLILLGEDGENILSRNSRLAFKISGKTWVNNHAHVLKPKPSMKLDYLVEFLESRDYAQYNTGTAQPKLNKSVCSELPVLCPPLPEQRAIAKALSDVDALLSALDRLTAKKRDLKQAAMQQLLTGQTRLPGFQGEWELKAFSSVLSRLNAKAHQIQTSDYQATGKYPVVDQGKEAVIGFSDREDRRFRCPDGGVIVFGDHTCFVKFIDFDFLVGADGTQVLHAKEGQSTRFHALQLQYRGVEPTGYNRHFKFLKERDFLAPSLLEQTAIAAVLCDMDAELAGLEQRRDKTRDLKQAMMQELLTGRTRLV